MAVRKALCGAVVSIAMLLTSEPALANCGVGKLVIAEGQPHCTPRHGNFVCINHKLQPVKECLSLPPVPAPAPAPRAASPAAENPPKVVPSASGYAVPTRSNMSGASSAR